MLYSVYMDAITKAIDHFDSAADFASAVGVSPQFVSQIKGKDRRWPTERCPDVEKVTNGEVTCEELRPDLNWVRIPDASWPNPKGRPLVDHSKAA